MPLPVPFFYSSTYSMIFLYPAVEDTAEVVDFCGGNSLILSHALNRRTANLQFIYEHIGRYAFFFPCPPKRIILNHVSPHLSNSYHNL